MAVNLRDNKNMHQGRWLLLIYSGSKRKWLDACFYASQ